MKKHSDNTVSESDPAGTVIGTCRIHPQKTYGINDHDPGVLSVDERTGEMYVINSTNISAAVEDYGFLVEASVDDVVVASKTYSVANLNYGTSAPAIDGNPSIVGVAQVGETLTIIAAPVTGVPEPTVTFQIRLADADYGASTTEATFVPQSGDVGGAFTVVQTASNGVGSDATATSAATAAIAAADAAPVINGVPTISGAAQVDQVLTAVPASVTSALALTTTWQWLLDAVNIGGATSINYTPIVGDIGGVITVKQTETNTAGSDNATSAATAAVIAVTPYNAAPVITSNGGGASAAISLAENITSVTTVTADYAYPVTYAITGGADAADFTINPTTGALAFNVTPDFAAPHDADMNNDYIVEVTASAGPESDVQTITITIEEQVGDTLGPELWVQPDFASVSGMTSFDGTTWSLSGGVATANGGEGSMSKSAILESGATYEYNVTIDSRTSGSLRWGWSGSDISLISTVGVATPIRKVADGTNIHIGSAAFVGSISHYSVKKVL